MKPRELEKHIRALLASAQPDSELRSTLERLATAELSFPGFTWLWGPELYRRNRLLFRPFVQSRFSSYMALPKWKIEHISWKGDQGVILDRWLEEVDRNDDVELFRKLLEWKLTSHFEWSIRDKRSAKVTAQVLERFRAATSPARRQIVLRKFDLWFELGEAAACELYRIDPLAAGPFILRRLKSGWYSGEPKRVLCTELIKLADERKDEDFRWRLYRLQVPVGDWTKECLALCGRHPDAAELVRELEKRHPQGWGVNLADGFFQLVQRRGRDVFPYVMRHLQQVWGGFLFRGKYGKLADYAYGQQWWDLWSALIRVCGSDREFNAKIKELLADNSLDEADQRLRLLALAGVSREWNWGGFGLVTRHALDDELAVRLHQRFPELLRGPFKAHVQAHRWGEVYPKLLRHCLDRRDDEMVDMLASRVVTRTRWGVQDKILADVEMLADYYTGLKANDTVFSRRAARVLGQVPAFAIFQYNQLIRDNRLARLLFERSAAAYLADPASMADLVEASEIHVMALAYRALGLDDERARAQAAQHLPLLLGTLLRPMQRGTRALAFGALANAAGTLDTARVILERARAALQLPDTRYPKEKLLGLIARLLKRWPELRDAAEQPVIYRRAA
jgi:hypothetical protein